MFISVSDELQLFVQEIQSFLSLNFVQNLATTSLAQLSSSLEASTEVLIIPEGLNKRFNKAAIQFLQHILTKLLNKKLTSSI